MARDRQRAKQRQRRADRLAERGSAGAPTAPRTSDPDAGLTADTLREEDLEELADLEVGAPPQDVGRSDRVLESSPPPPDLETDDEALELEGLDDGRDVGTARAAGPRGVSGAATPSVHERGRLVAFLVAVWAELGRVQWPDRQQLVQLTGVVLFFVLVIGAYLGGLDAVFSKLINAIL